MNSESPDADRMTPLAALLHGRMEEMGWRLRDVTRPPDGTRIGAPARATMSQHLQAGYWLKTMPRQKTIDELAIAVRLPPKEIRDAAWRSREDNSKLPAGEEDTGLAEALTQLPGQVRRVVTAMMRLGPRQQTKVENFVMLLVDEMDVADGPWREPLIDVSADGTSPEPAALPRAARKGTPARHRQEAAESDEPA